MVREFGGTGNTNQGADRFGSTAPTIYMGKGLGDLPIGLLRPFAITGEPAYNFRDVRLNSTGDTMGGQNALNAGLSIQYSMPYLQSQVKDFGLPEFLNHLVPLVEFTWSVPIGGVVMPSPTNHIPNRARSYLHGRYLAVWCRSLDPREHCNRDSCRGHRTVPPIL